MLDPDADDSHEKEREPLIAPPQDVPPVSAEALVDGDIPSPEEEERRYPSTIGGAFYLLLLAVCTVGVAVVVVGDWRVGVRVIGGALVAGSLVRLVLPNRDAGMLAVRARLLDVVLLAALGGALIFLADSIPGQPGP